MQIYKDEIDDGLSEIIEAKACIDLVGSITLEEPTQEIDPKNIISLAKSAGINIETIDDTLFSLSSILVTVDWNENDDIFVKKDTWEARNTPINKPLNYEHEQDDIIGHIVNSRVIDFEGGVIPDESELEQVPERFHIITDAILYKYWRDAMLQERMNTILGEINDNLWYVSMEARAMHFDYGIMEGDQFRVIERNDSTAFLSKFLRVFGGEGKYMNWKIGRVLRNLVFVGKGLVKQPANKYSHIIQSSEILESIASETEVMADTNLENVSAELESVKTKLEQTQDSLAALTVERDRLSKENADLEVASKSAEAKAKESDDELDTLKAKVKELTEQLSTATASVETSQKELEEAKAEMDKHKKELEKKAKEEKAKARAAQYKEKTSKSDEDCKAFVEKFEGLNDEQFDAVLASLGSSDESDEDDDDSSDSDSTASAADEALKNAQKDNQPNNAQAGVTNDEGTDEDDIQAAVQEFSTFISAKYYGKDNSESNDK